MANAAVEFMKNHKRPEVTVVDAKDVLRRHYGLQTVEITEMDSYFGRNFYVKVEDKHSNENISELWPHGYVLKIVCEQDSLSNHTVAEHACFQHLASKGFNVPLPVPTKDNKFTFIEEFTGIQSKEKHQHLVHLVTFLPGKVLINEQITTSVLFQVGKFCGQLHQALKDFQHPGVEDVNIASGSLDYVLPRMMDFASELNVKEERHLSISILQSFMEKTLPMCNKLHRCVIHGDLTPNNFLVHSAQEGFSLLDLGDMNNSFNVFEVGIAIMHFMISPYMEVEVEDVGGHILAGYLQESELTEEEKKILPICVHARFIHCVVLGKKVFEKNPENEYVLQFVDGLFAVLHKMLKIPDEELLHKWQTIIDSYK